LKLRESFCDETTVVSPCTLNTNSLLRCESPSQRSWFGMRNEGKLYDSGRVMNDAGLDEQARTDQLPQESAAAIALYGA
jgi:hypothetical protein